MQNKQIGTILIKYRKYKLDGVKEILYGFIVIARLLWVEQFAPGPPTGGDIPRFFLSFCICM